MRYRRAHRFPREYFVSYPDQVLVGRWYSTGRRSCACATPCPTTAAAETRIETGKTGARLVVSGALKSNGLKYGVALLLIPECGTVQADGDALPFEGECAVDFVLAARTNYRMRYPDYRDGARTPRRRGEGRTPRPQDSIDAGAPARRGLPTAVRAREARLAAAATKLPTDRLRAGYGGGNAGADRALEQLYFNYGRYLLIASSRGGSLPANLQGVWNDKATPPWNADYHVNINLQMNYWPAEVANLAETAEPLFDFVEHLVPPGRLAAQRFFGAPGWTMFLNTNAWGYVGPIDWPTAFWQPEASAWLAQHFYEHYRFSRDLQFLKKRAWPVMKGASEFWLATLVADPRDGKLVVSPSYSPEHGPFTAGAAMSQQIVADLFTNAAEAARRVGDKAFAKRLDDALAKLDRGLHVGKWGQLQEWKVDLDDAKDDHRHVSHLFALHPGRAIDAVKDVELARAARATLDARGDASTGWSRAWKINFWARLRDGDRAHKLLAGLLRDSTLPNLWDTHPPFQIDGNYGATAGMIEMLLQSQNDVIDILPALPKSWARGSVQGIRARGDVTVGITWDTCGLAELALDTGRAATLTLRSALFEGNFDSAAALKGEGAQRTLSARAKGHYDFRRSTACTP